MNKSSTSYIDASKHNTDNQSPNKLVPIQGKYRSVSPIVLHKHIDDYDELQINLLQSKDSCNKKNQEIKHMKLVLSRLNQDHNTNVRLIGKILKTANKSQEKQPNDICEQIQQGDFTKQNMHLLKETHQSLILKRKNLEVRSQIDNSVKELEDLKLKTRAARLIELENAMHLREDKINVFTKENEALQVQANELELKIKESIANVDFHKTNTIKIQIDYQDTQIQLKEQNQKNDALKKTKLSYEEKISNQRFTIKTLKKSLKQKDIVLQQYEINQSMIDKFKNEKPLFEKNEEEKINKIKELTNELNNLNEKAKQLETEHISNKEKLSEFDKERAKFLPFLKEQNATYKDKDRKIKQLEDSIKKETNNKDEAEKDIKTKTDILDNEVEELTAQMNSLHKELIDLNQVGSTIDDELTDLNNQKRKYITKDINDHKKIQELTVKIEEMNKIKDNPIFEVQANKDEEEKLITNETKPKTKDKNKQKGEEKEEDDDEEVLRQIKELEGKVKKTEEILEKNVEMNRENEDIIKNLNNQIEIDQLVKEIEDLRNDIKKLQMVK